MNIFIDLSMVIYQIVDKDRIWLTNWYIRHYTLIQTQVGHTTSESYNLSNKRKESRPYVLRNIGQGKIGKNH